ncbi:MAG: amino acid permease [Methanomicrobiales archaeon]|nr:amino acid permease [Methanomicrobiales archaeon]
MPGKSSNGFTIGLLAFILITSAALISMRTFPTMAVAGWDVIFFSVLALILYLIPASLVSAELATGWPQEGGVYIWVKQAFGERWGFTAVWLQWFQMTIGFITILAFIAATFAYVFNPALSDNKLYVFVVMVAVWWVMTAINFHGLKAYTRISSVAVIIGTLIPAIVMITGGVWYIMAGNPVQLTLHPAAADLIPDLSNAGSLVLLVTFVFSFIGIEMTATHAREMDNVERNYPLGILVVALMMTVIHTVGALIVAMLVPGASLNLLSGIMQTFADIFSNPAIAWLVPLFAVLIAFGAIGQVSTWILGPVRGLFVAAREGTLPPALQNTNKNGIPVNMLILQAVFITFWGAVFVLLPGGVNGAFWILLALTTAVYIVMYLLMYAAVIRLRYTQPDVPRAFKIPGGKTGIWLIAGFGFLAMAAMFILALIPPTQIKEGAWFPLFMIAGTIAVVSVPLIIHAMKKPEWKIHNRPGVAARPAEMNDAENETALTDR